MTLRYIWWPIIIWTTNKRRRLEKGISAVLEKLGRGSYSVINADEALESSPSALSFHFPRRKSTCARCFNRINFTVSGMSNGDKKRFALSTGKLKFNPIRWAKQNEQRARRKVGRKSISQLGRAMTLISSSCNWIKCLGLETKNELD